MNKAFYFSVFFLSISAGISAMNQDININSIERNVKATNETCQQQCSFIDDVTNACTSNCRIKIYQRMENHLIQRYTAMCQKKTFNKTFNFTPTIEEEAREAGDTVKAYFEWENPAIKNCAQSYLSDYAQKLQLLEAEVNQKLRNEEMKHPLIAQSIRLKSKIRRQK